MIFENHSTQIVHITEKEDFMESSTNTQTISSNKSARSSYSLLRILFLVAICLLPFAIPEPRMSVLTAIAGKLGLTKVKLYEGKLAPAAFYSLKLVYYD